MHRLQRMESAEKHEKSDHCPHLARAVIALDPPFPRSPSNSPGLGRANDGSESIVLILGLQLLHGSAHPLWRLGILRISSRKKRKQISLALGLEQRPQSRSTHEGRYIRD